MPLEHDVILMKAPTTWTKSMVQAFLNGKVAIHMLEITTWMRWTDGSVYLGMWEKGI
jgi:hypothetical protein